MNIYSTILIKGVSNCCTKFQQKLYFSFKLRHKNACIRVHISLFIVAICIFRFTYRYAVLIIRDLGRAENVINPVLIRGIQ